MREKAKSMWEKSQMSVGKAMSSAVTNLAGYVSSMWNKNSETGNQGNLLIGKPENPNNQHIIEPRTESTISHTITNPVENPENPKPGDFLTIQWNEGTVANTASITPTISGDTSARSIRKGMEGGINDTLTETTVNDNVVYEPVKQFSYYINEEGKLTEGSYLINADNPNPIAKILFAIGNGRLDLVPNLVHESTVNGETVLVVIDPPILEILGIDIETMRIALKTENYQNSENPELQGYVIDVQRKIFATLAAFESMPTREGNNPSVSIIKLSDTIGNDTALNSTSWIESNNGTPSPVSFITIGGQYFGENQTDNQIGAILQRVLRDLRSGLNKKAEAILEGIREDPRFIPLIQVPNVIINILVESNPVYHYVMNEIIQSGIKFTTLSPKEQVDTVMKYAKNAFKNPAIMFNAVIEASRLHEKYQEAYNDLVGGVKDNPLFKVPENMDMAPVANEFLNKVIESIGIEGLKIEITVDKDNLIAPNITLTPTLPDGQKLGIKLDPNSTPVSPNGSGSSPWTRTFKGTLTGKDGSIEDVDITILPDNITYTASSKTTSVINSGDGTTDVVIGKENVIVSENTSDGQPLDRLFIINQSEEVIDPEKWDFDHDLEDVTFMNVPKPNNSTTDTLTGEVVDPLFNPNILFNPNMEPLIIINNTLTKTITDPYPNYTSPNDTSPNDTLANSSNSQENYQNGEPDVLTGGEDNQTTDDSQKISTPSPDEVLANNLANSNGQNNETDNNTDQKVNFSDGVPDVLTGGEGNQTTSIPKNDYYYDELKILLPSKGDHSLVIPNGYPIDNLTVTDTNGAELTSSITPEGPLFETTNGEAKLVIERDGGKNYYRNQDNKNSFPNNIQNDPLTGDTTNQVDIDPITAILRENLKDVSREKLAILKDVSNIIPPVSPTFDPLTDGGSDTANGEYDEFILGSNNKSFEGYGQLPTNKQPISDILPSNPEYWTKGKTDPLTGNTLGSSDNRGDIFIPNNPKTF